MYNENVGIITTATTELILCKFYEFLLRFQKMYTSCGLFFFLHELWVNEGEAVKKVKIIETVTRRKRVKGYPSTYNVEISILFSTELQLEDTESIIKSKIK